VLRNAAAKCVHLDVDIDVVQGAILKDIMGFEKPIDLVAAVKAKRRPEVVFAQATGAKSLDDEGLERLSLKPGAPCGEARQARPEFGASHSCVHIITKGRKVTAKIALHKTSRSARHLRSP
jgi:hypothetical protein